MVKNLGALHMQCWAGHIPITTPRQEQTAYSTVVLYLFPKAECTGILSASSEWLLYPLLPILNSSLQFSNAGKIFNPNTPCLMFLTQIHFF